SSRKIVEKSMFFLQAEDGIRDGHVTGVQTCALPILTFFLCYMVFLFFPVAGPRRGRTGTPCNRGRTSRPRREWFGAPGRAARSRSEERRGGKEWTHRRKTCYSTKSLLLVRAKTICKV